MCDRMTVAALIALLCLGGCSDDDEGARPDAAVTARDAQPDEDFDVERDLPGEADPVVVAAAGDIAGNWIPMNMSGFYETSDLLLEIRRRRGLHAILTPGDLAYPWGRLEDFQTFYAPSWGRPALKALTRPVPGNHEYENGLVAADGYFDFWNGVGNREGQAGARDRGWYSYDIGAWHFVALNSSHECHTPISCAEGSPQHAWLVQDLAQTTKRCVLAYWHHPRFHFGVHPDGVMAAPLWNALHDAGAELVVNGHEHNFQHIQPLDKEGRLDPNGIRSFVVGTGGIDTFYGPDFMMPSPMLHGADPAALGAYVLQRHGVLVLTLRPDGYDWQFIAIKEGEPLGEVVLSGSGACR